MFHKMRNYEGCNKIKEDKRQLICQNTSTKSKPGFALAFYSKLKSLIIYLLKVKNYQCTSKKKLYIYIYILKIIHKHID